MKRGWAITCISLSLGCGGFAWAGFSINHLDIAPQVDNMSYNPNSLVLNDSIMIYNRLNFYHFIFIVCSNPHGDIEHNWNNTWNHQPASYWISNQRQGKDFNHKKVHKNQKHIQITSLTIFLYSYDATDTRRMAVCLSYNCRNLSTGSNLLWTNGIWRKVGF